ncbi:MULTISPECIES: carboxylesterase family protein [Acidobacterium]|uniref:carboxylesterase/lipase family protein n=1 Tax=Acidobacterium TaxID=33973 RepID=UPI0002D66722|nr:MULTISPECIES: carboxylesterase family protein [Acidobacterium]HCT61145.1 carboxylesterase/lipase family protein [Acidobacterium sp.]
MSKSKTGNEFMLSRRAALKLSAGAGVAAAMGQVAHASDSTKTGVHQQQPPYCSTPDSAVASTKYGKVRGFVSGNVFTFKGVPYGQDTGGENRWLPAKEPAAWEGEYPALIYGANCPQNLHDWHSQEQVFIQDWDDGWQSEDMLKLNVWTPSLSGRRPVMFYIHGGGYEFGSAYELPSHEGANMARYHDVVAVSVNHRLNALGFLDVSEVGGEEYRDSSNVGMTDLVAALRWVKENIANFGGDPDCVMIYGQSGGGGKVATLMGMPAAQGLFHRAAIQSGGAFFGSAADAKALTRQMMKDLGLAPNDIGALRKMDWRELMTAADVAQGKLPANPHMPFKMHGPPHHFWMPTSDGHVIPGLPFEDAAPEMSKHIPLMIGSVSEEGNMMASRPTEEEWRAGLARAYGEERGTAIADGLKKAYPHKSVRTLSYMCSGGGFLNALSMRNGVVRMAKLKHDLKAAPVYTYYFTWQTKILDGVPGAWHTSDLQFCFDNTMRCEQGTGNTPEAQALARKMATAWANFARTGNPSQPGIRWEPTDPVSNRTMVWDNVPRMVDDPDGALRKLVL